MAKKKDKVIRTKALIDQEYQHHALHLGHKSRILHQLGDQQTQLEKEIQDHLKALLALNSEGSQMQDQQAASTAQETQAPASDPAQQTTTTEAKV